MKIRHRHEDPRFPRRGEGIFSLILLSVVTDFLGGIVAEVVIPKVKRLFGEEDYVGCDCAPPKRAP